MPLLKGSVAVLDWGARGRSAGPGSSSTITHPRRRRAPIKWSSRETASSPGRPPLRSFGGCCPRRPPWLAAVGAFGDLGDPAFALPEFDHQTGSVPAATIELAHAV
jgi:hypothetical protein